MNETILRICHYSLWSSRFIAIILGLKYVDPFTFLFYRLMIAALCMFLISLLTKAPWPNNWNTLRKTLIVGFLSQFLYLTTYFYALYYDTSPVVMSIILALQPLLTAVIYSGLLKKKIFITQYIGLFLGLIGVLITMAHDLSVHNITYFGCILMLICLCSITVGSIIQKSNSEMDFRTGSTLQFAISVIPLFLGRKSVYFYNNIL